MKPPDGHSNTNAPIMPCWSEPVYTYGPGSDFIDLPSTWGCVIILANFDDHYIKVAPAERARGEPRRHGRRFANTEGRQVSSVLVLNATYEPLSVVSVRRAVVLLLKEKAEMVEAAEAELRSEHVTMPMPLVIRLVYYVRIPYRVALPLTRRTVLARDHYTCQYCGKQPPRKDLTVDHVLPRSRGGHTSWENVVTACQRCNGHKGNRTPEEANMRLLSRPGQPRYVALAMVESADTRQAWRKYIF
jgi:5-methylcytosine-specific restriction endonuclease McrA